MVRRRLGPALPGSCWRLGDGIGESAGPADRQPNLEWRENDGWQPIAPDSTYLLPPFPGQWQPTPPANSFATFTFYPRVKPFALLTSAQFLSTAPPTLTRDLGIKYVYIPMRGTADHPYGPKELDAFAAAMAAADGKVLLHCTIAWRASHLWAAYLIRDRKVPVARALEQTRMINL